MKKYIITNKESNAIIAMSDELDIQQDNNWVIKPSNTAYPSEYCFAYDADGQLPAKPIAGTVKIGEGVEVPGGVLTWVYGYTKSKGFFEIEG